MSTRSSTRPSPSFKIHKIQRHGIDLFMFNAAEHHPSKVPFLAVVLQPTADAIGLNPRWFDTVLRRSRNEELTHSVKEFKFHPSVFATRHLDALQTVSTTSRGGVRVAGYQCLPITKMEVLLNGIDVERLKNPNAKRSILNLQKTINEAIEHYYHKGVAINKKATVAQLEKGRDVLERRIAALIAKNDVLSEKNAEQADRISKLEAKLARLTAEIAELRELNQRMLVRVDRLLRRGDRLAASVKRNVGRANLAGWHLMRKEEFIDEQTALIEQLTERVSVNRSSKMKYKAMVAEYKMSMERLREDLPGFKSKKLSRLPSFLRLELGKFLEATRDCFQSVLEQKKLTEEFKVMTLNLFPEMTAREYDTIVKEFNEPLKPEDYVMDAEPHSKRLGSSS